MIVIRSPRRMAALSRRWQAAGRRIGLVPTMGALHGGHASLIRRAAAENDVTIVTVFVNPLQFGPREDFARYPRPFARDRRIARAAGADVVFAPARAALYPQGFSTSVDVGPLGACWEGRARPGHFRGVATVVAILFGVTRPTRAYFGRKDYQQTLVVRRLIEDLKLPVLLRALPTVREPDGLAMSSRNAYLAPAERRQARVLAQALRAARAQIRAGAREVAALERRLRRMIAAAPSARVEYVAFVEADTLRVLRRLRGRVMILLAVWFGRTRLIDNLLVVVP